MSRARALAGRVAEHTVVRFAAVGVVNTLIDLVLFVLLEPHLGVVTANLVSSSAGMAFSFVVNGRFTFRSERRTWRHAALFLATTGTVMWVLQPLLIAAVLAVVDVLVVAKLAAIAGSFVANYAAYRWVVWPAERDTGDIAEDITGGIAGEWELSSDPRP